MRRTNLIALPLLAALALTCCSAGNNAGGGANSSGPAASSDTSLAPAPSPTATRPKDAKPVGKDKDLFSASASKEMAAELGSPLEAMTEKEAALGLKFSGSSSDSSDSSSSSRPSSSPSSSSGISKPKFSPAQCEHLNLAEKSDKEYSFGALNNADKTIVGGTGNAPTADLIANAKKKLEPCKNFTITMGKIKGKGSYAPTELTTPDRHKVLKLTMTIPMEVANQSTTVKQNLYAGIADETTCYSVAAKEGLTDAQAFRLIDKAAAKKQPPRWHFVWNEV